VQLLNIFNIFLVFEVYLRGPLSLVSTIDRLCGLVVRVPGYRSRDPASIPGTTRFSEKYWVWNGVHSLRSTTEELLGRNTSGSGIEIRKYGRRDPSR
jgi:hypothetical protein